MKDAKKIRAHFKDKPVAFVYVSEDEDEAMWQTAVKELDMADGINTHLEKGKTADLVDKYEAGSIPTHYLIDKQGRFAKEINVARPPEQKELIAQIERLLE